ncbi:MAG: outer membrane beta-barrel protein [Rhizobiaceae bacterium]
MFKFGLASAILAAASLSAAGNAIAADTLADAPLRGTVSWTGAYVSAHVGAGWLRDSDTNFPANPSRGDGGIFGASVGYLHQMGGFVGGAEAGYRKQKIQFVSNGWDPFNFYAQDAYSLELRAGAAFDRWLVTANAGVVYATSNIIYPLTGAGPLADWGYTAGVSADYLISDHVFVGAKYDHQFYRNFAGNPTKVDVDTGSLKVGYKF